MNILDHELVRKYFAGCDHASDSFNSGCLCRLNYAAKILRAMQQPIREGDRMLRVASTGFVDDQTAGGLIDDPLHFEYLRLPDRFQKVGKKEHCESCRCVEAMPEQRASCKQPMNHDRGCDCNLRDDEAVTCAVCGHVGTRIQSDQQPHSCSGRLVDEAVEAKIVEILKNFIEASDQQESRKKDSRTR